MLIPTVAFLDQPRPVSTFASPTLFKRMEQLVTVRDLHPNSPSIRSECAIFFSLQYVSLAIPRYKACLFPGGNRKTDENLRNNGYWTKGFSQKQFCIWSWWNSLWFFCRQVSLEKSNWNASPYHWDSEMSSLNQKKALTSSWKVTDWSQLQPLCMWGHSRPRSRTQSYAPFPKCGWRKGGHLIRSVGLNPSPPLQTTLGYYTGQRCHPSKAPGNPNRLQ